MTSSVAGFTASKVFPDLEATHLPLMSNFFGAPARKSSVALLTVTGLEVRCVVSVATAAIVKLLSSSVACSCIVRLFLHRYGFILRFLVFIPYSYFEARENM